jgi:hypothetical protein
MTLSNIFNSGRHTNAPYNACIHSLLQIKLAELKS